MSCTKRRCTGCEKFFVALQEALGRLGFPHHHQDRDRLPRCTATRPPRMSSPRGRGRRDACRRSSGAFLLIGATSFGGGVVAYLRSSLVDKHHWIDDRTFVECLAIGQTLPGLNATNMSVLVGDRLRGTRGRGRRGHRHVPARGAAHVRGRRRVRDPWQPARRRRDAARGRGRGHRARLRAHRADRARRRSRGAGDLRLRARAPRRRSSVFHFKVLHVLLVVGALSIWWHRPRGRRRGGRMNETPGTGPGVLLPVAPHDRRRHGGVPRARA